MSRHFLLDGYNLIQKDPRLAELSLEDGRAGLVRFVQNNRPQGSARNTVTIVFDGQEGICSLNFFVDVRVMFSRGETADDVIKRLVEQDPSPREAVVVTDDREIQRFCSAMGAEILGVTQFFAQGRKMGAQLRSGIVKGRSGKAERKEISGSLEAKINREFKERWLKK